MAVKTVQRDEFEQSAGPLLDYVNQGNEVIIVEAQEVCARLAPAKAKHRAGMHRGEVWVSEDFDEPLPEEFWLGERP